MRIAVFGATGGTGRQVVTQALNGGHQVNALVRSGSAADRMGAHERLRVVAGRLEEPGDVDAVVAGADVVISTLGATVRGPTSVCTDGAAAVLGAMRRQHVRRLLVVSAHGTAESHDRSPYVRAVWATQRHRMRDKESMEALLRAAERDGTVDVTVVRPPALTDGPRTGRYTTGADVRIRLTSSIARADVADFLLRSAVTGSYVGRAPRIAGAAPPWSTRQRRAGTRPAARRLPPATTLRQAR